MVLLPVTGSKAGSGIVGVAVGCGFSGLSVDGGAFVGAEVGTSVGRGGSVGSVGGGSVGRGGRVGGRLGRGGSVGCSVGRGGSVAVGCCADATGAGRAAPIQIRPIVPMTIPARISDRRRIVSPVADRVIVRAASGSRRGRCRRSRSRYRLSATRRQGR